jgi:threonine/homoserine efflux transporter RhtA
MNIETLMATAKKNWQIVTVALVMAGVWLVIDGWTEALHDDFNPAEVALGVGVLIGALLFAVSSAKKS